MSSIIETSGSGGIDLSSLTSGEQFLIGLVGSGYASPNASSNGNAYFQLAYCSFDSTQYPNQWIQNSLVDFSNIQSINADLQAYVREGNRSSCTIYYRMRYVNTSGTDVNYETTVSSFTTPSGYDHQKSVTGVTARVVSTNVTNFSYAKYIQFYLYVYNTSSTVSLSGRINGFTTQDGKYHSRDNLNY